MLNGFAGVFLFFLLQSESSKCVKAVLMFNFQLFLWKEEKTTLMVTDSLLLRIFVDECLS
jgi:hypothetical protein